MIDWKVTQKKRILESVKKLQNIPTFKEYKTTGLSLNWDKMKATKKVFTQTIKEQIQSYKLRWLAEALFCSLDTPRQAFYKHLSNLQEAYKQDKKVSGALIIVKEFLDKMR